MQRSKKLGLDIFKIVLVIKTMALPACAWRSPGTARAVAASSTASTTSVANPAPTPSPTPSPAGLHVVRGTAGADGFLADAAGARVRLHGVNRMGTEYMCLYGGFADGPVDQANVDAMKSWNVDAVRVPLNESCWLGINGAPAASSGAPYRAAVKAWVALLTANGLSVILDLHWAAPGPRLANAQLPMANADHSVQFWTEVATAYANQPNVLFDLYNEPTVTDWTCWARGGRCAKDDQGVVFEVAGMATLLKAVRATGARNVVIMGGLSYSADFRGWVDAVESIPAFNGSAVDNVAASYHQYDYNSLETLCPTVYNGYSTSQTCRTGAQTLAAAGSRVDLVLAAGFPVILGESGISAYSASSAAHFTPAQLEMLKAWHVSLLDQLYGRGQSVFAWTFTPGTPSLIQNTTTYAPTPYFGETYRAWLAGK